MAINKASVKALAKQYLDEVIVVHLNNIQVVTVDEGGHEMKIAAMIDGLVNEIDQDFIHLTSREGFPRTIPHSMVGLIELAVLEEDLSFAMPENGEEIH